MSIWDFCAYSHHISTKGFLYCMNGNVWKIRYLIQSHSFSCVGDTNWIWVGMTSFDRCGGSGQPVKQSPCTCLPHMWQRCPSHRWPRHSAWSCLPRWTPTSGYCRECRSPPARRRLPVMSSIMVNEQKIPQMCVLMFLMVMMMCSSFDLCNTIKPSPLLSSEQTHLSLHGKPQLQQCLPRTRQPH